jgi:GntR family colanic acid and biofilm gene transcriptional regulator
MPNAEISSSTLADAVYEKLLKDIKYGKIVPGQRITLRGIAEELKISITPVREALRRLETLQLISYESNRWFTVQRISPEKMREILDVEKVLERHAIFTAAENINQQSIMKMEDLIDELIVAKNSEEFLIKGRELMLKIFRQSGNETLFEIIKQLWDREGPYVHAISEGLSKARRKKILAYYENIVNAMKHKNPEEAWEWFKKDSLEIDRLMFVKAGEDINPKGYVKK